MLIASAFLAILISIPHSKAIVLCVEDSECAIGVSPKFAGCLTPKLCRQCNYNEPTNIGNGLQDCIEASEPLTTCDGDFRCPEGSIDGGSNNGGSNTDSPSFIFKTRRNFEIENKCDFPVWVGFNGRDPETNGFVTDGVPNDGGWYMDKYEIRTINIPNIHAGNIWARTNCGYDTDFSAVFDPFRCDSGECWASFNDYGKDGSCCGHDENGNYICAGPKAPASLAEFTLANNENQNDFYDVSLVDGYGIPVSFQPIDGTYNLEDTLALSPNLGDNACGDARVNLFDAESKCPVVLRIDGTQTRDSSISFDFTQLKYCRSICKSVDDPFQTDPMLIAWKNEGDASDVLDEFYSDDDILDEHVGKRLLDLLCCQCGEGGGGCYDEDKTCNYGCTPFLENGFLDPNAWTDSREAYEARMCPNYGLTVEDGDTEYAMPLWPLVENPSGQFINPAFIYRDTSPNAYSWQFDDISATFQCRNADYKITFCG